MHKIEVKISKQVIGCSRYRFNVVLIFDFLGRYPSISSFFPMRHRLDILENCFVFLFCYQSILNLMASICSKFLQFLWDVWILKPDGLKLVFLHLEGHQQFGAGISLSFSFNCKNTNWILIALIAECLAARMQVGQSPYTVIVKKRKQLKNSSKKFH